MRPIIIAGISTDVGKTVAAAVTVLALEADYWKPVQCGLPRDTDWILQYCGTGLKTHPEAYQFKTPCSAHKAAKIEGRRVDVKEMMPPRTTKTLVIEGAGGILSPLNEETSWIDAALEWRGLWIVVHRPYLGSLNHFLLTMEALKQRHQEILGVVFNGEDDPTTEKMLMERTKTPCIGKLPWIETLTPQVLRNISTEWRPKLLHHLGLKGAFAPSGSPLPRH